jgi:hypothetical protein
MMSLSTGGALGRFVSSKVADPFQFWNKNPEIVDPLNLTDAQQVKAQREYDKKTWATVTRARALQEEINQRYGLQGNLTIYGEHAPPKKIRSYTTKELATMRAKSQTILGGPAT